MSGMLERGFLDDIAKNIDDDTPRLVYADWLIDNGKDDRAEFIRVQIDRARLPAWDARQVRLRLREQELLKRHGEQWLSELPTIEGAKWEGFRRGIVAEVSFADYEVMRKSAHACRAVAPVEAVTVRWPRKAEGQHESPIAELRELSLTGRPGREEEVQWLADSPQLATLRALTVRGLWLETMRRMMVSPHLGNLKSLRLPSNNLGNAGIGVLTQSSSISSLEELELHGRMYEAYGEDPTVSASCVSALAAWRGLLGVRVLRLTGSNLGKAGFRALLRSPLAGSLKVLSLRGGQFDGTVMGELMDAAPALRLESLDLGDNVLKQVGAEYVALAPCLSTLQELWLDRCDIPLDGARLLAKKAKFLGGLKMLHVGHNHFGPTGLQALLDRAPASLHTLMMRDNDLFDNGVEILASSAASETLLEVDLSQNHLTARSATALAESEHLSDLLILRLLENPISESAGRDLANSPLGQRLAVLELKEPPPPAAPPVPPPSGDDIPF